jgi:hypothetical protein
MSQVILNIMKVRTSEYKDSDPELKTILKYELYKARPKRNPYQAQI